MDLRSVLNTSDAGDRGHPKAPHTSQQQPPLQQPQQQQQQQQRLTQSPAQYYREYPPHQQPHPSPGNTVAHDYPHASPRQQPHPSSSFPPPSPYQAPGPYPGRPAPPPLQPTSSYHDVRSPRPGSIPAPAPSPYRSTTTPSSAGGGAAGYPFPPTQPQAPHDIASPSQRHQYPPGPYQQVPQQVPQHQRRDSFSQGVPSQGPGPYVQQQPVPQTPPVGTPGGSSYPYMNQQRSQSVHSTPTPTSAHSQHQFGQPYAQASPANSTHQSVDYSRPPSQPPTPLGPPLSINPRQQGPGPGSFAQPSSPYQQRVASIPGGPVVQTHAQAAQVSQPLVHPSPPPQRMSSTHSVYDSPTRDHRRSLSHLDREHSLSVSPKTRVPSLPSNPDRSPSSAKLRATSLVHNIMADSDRAVTPGKRKLDERDLSPAELERKEPRPPPAEVNGGHGAPVFDSRAPEVPKKKRTARAQPPIWAQSSRTLGKTLPSQANFVLQKRHAPHLNGTKDSVGRSEQESRPASPEAARSQPASQTPALPAPEPGPQDSLGPWEPSITGVKPSEEVSRAVADFLFINVINNDDIQEIMSRGIQFEIEAKLGKLIDKDTNQRISRGLASEAVLRDTGRVAFKSSMTEAQHKSFNDFLNQMVIQTDPRNPNGGGNRVQVHYKHRREIDRFYEIPPALQDRLPGCVRARLGPRKNVKVRVTYDQKTREVLNKIVKTRVADFDLHLATCPMDCRISINLEMNWEGPVEELEAIAANSNEKYPDRNKDRLSYNQGHYQVDLTQVTQNLTGPGNAQHMEKEHELEIELSPGIVIDQGRKAMSGGRHHYQELVDGLVDNVRVLARKAADFE